MLLSWLFMLSVLPAAGAAPAEPDKPVPAWQAQREELRVLQAAFKQHVEAGEWEAAKASLAKLRAHPRGSSFLSSYRREIGWVDAVGSSIDPIGLDVDDWIQKPVALPHPGLTVIYFFETWDPWCRTNIDIFDRIHEDHDSKTVQVVGLTRMTRNTSKDTLLKFLEEARVDMPIASIHLTARIADHGSEVHNTLIVKDMKIVWAGGANKVRPAVDALLRE